MQAIWENDKKIMIHDVIKGTHENIGNRNIPVYSIEFRDRIVNMSLRYGHLIVATSNQCHIYNERNWNTPSIIDLRNNGRVTCIQQSRR